MDIDISELKSREVIKILELYPQGHLEIKYERVFWCSDYTEPETRYNPKGTPAPGVPIQKKGNAINLAAQRMSDTLGSMMGNPRREE